MNNKKKKLSLVDALVFRTAKNSLDAFDQQLKDQEHKKNEDVQTEDSSSNQIDKLATEQVGKITSKQVDNITNKQVDNLPQQVINSTGYQLNTLTSKQLNNLASKHIDNSSCKQTSNITSKQVPSFNLLKKPHDLKLNQFRILYEIYFNRPFKVDGPYRIGKSAGIPYGTTRYCIQSLVVKGYISKPYNVNSSTYKGSYCKVNESRCVPLFGHTEIPNIDQVNKLTTEQLDILPGYQPGNFTSDQVDKLTTGQLDNITSKQDYNIVSSKFINKTNLLTRELAENPNLAYWQDKLKAQKIESWMEEFNIPEDDMIESLSHCAFEMTRRGETDKKGQKIENVLDWFYSIIKKNRFYDRPAGYKSFEEIALERAEQRLKEKQERINRINEIKKAEREADIDLQFSEMMQNPESEEYKKCYDLLNEIAKRKNSGTIFTSVMRSQFIELFFPEELSN